MRLRQLGEDLDVHRKRHDHGPAFWQLIDGHMLGWRGTNKQLDGLVEVLVVE